MATAGHSGPDRTPPDRREGFSLRARLRSFAWAWAGGRVLVRGQHNAWIHGAATLLVLLLGLACRVSRLEWAVLGLAVGLVWAMEALNTAIELLADEVCLERRERIGQAKDVAAFGVLAAALAAMVVGVLVFWPYLFN
ncbi:MAG: diacylglycerol kinase family protein [Desulfobulbus sp.]|nr:diacylglycerol kinase family protein [Desulfobulbus sp.]